MVYSDHEVFKTLLTGLNNTTHGRIAGWQERLSEYDIHLFPRSAKSHFMGRAGGLSRLPTDFFHSMRLKPRKVSRRI